MKTEYSTEDFAFAKVDKVTGFTSGYLLKYSSSTLSRPTWKKRYFVLRGNSLSYYDDHSMGECKADVFLLGETEVRPYEMEGKQFCISLRVPFNIIQLSAQTIFEQTLWVESFQKAINIAKQSLRGYYFKVSNSSDGQRKKKYFVMHEHAIAFYKDMEHLVAPQTCIHLQASTAVDFVDASEVIVVTDPIAKQRITIDFKDASGAKSADSELHFSKWKKVFFMKLQHDSPAAAEAVPFIKEGNLGMRPEQGGEVWPEILVRLFNSQLIVFEAPALDSSSPLKMIDSFDISPCCSVFSTNLGENTFELVTPNKVLHVCTRSVLHMEDWILNIRQAISDSILDTSDPLFQKALLKIDDDEYYEARFTEKASLGIVFERCGEWAIIKTSTRQSATGIEVGSVLSAVNGESVVLENYHNTISKLKDWQPVLRLGFRRVPRKEGFLLKESKSKKDGERRLWKKRYFILAKGKLAYKTRDGDDEVKNELPLMGSAVSLLTKEETGREACFRLLSGVACLIVQCASNRQAMDWASSLYHAIAIANGGSYVLMYETDRVEAGEGPVHIPADKATLKFTNGTPGSDSDSGSGAQPRSVREASGGQGRDQNKAASVGASAILVQQTADVGATASASRKSGESSLQLVQQGGADSVAGSGVMEVAVQSATEAGRRAEVFGLLTKAVERKDNVMLQRVLAIADELKLSGEEIILARSMLVTRSAVQATTSLTSAIAQAGASTIQYLSDAIVSARQTDVSAALLADAKMQMFRLQQSRGEQINLMDQLQAAVVAQNLPELEAAFMAAKRAGITCSTVGEASELISSLQRVNSEKMLLEAMQVASVEELECLEDAIELAKLRGANPQKISEAEATARKLHRQSRDPMYVTRLVQEALSQRSIFKLGVALERSTSIGLINDAVGAAKSALQEMMREEQKRTAISKLSDAVLLRSIPALQLALDMSQELDIRDPSVDQARDYLVQLQRAERIEDHYSVTSMNGVMIRGGGVNGASISVDGTGAFTGGRLLPHIGEPNGLDFGDDDEFGLGFGAGGVDEGLSISYMDDFAKVTVGDEDIDDILEAVVEPSRPAEPRKMAIRKSRVFKFDTIEDAASESDLRQVFRKYGTRAKAEAAGISLHEDALDFINAMQFSNIWRVITGEKGNLFKEMQVFKRFDVSGNGVLSEEDFVDGWDRMALEPANIILLKRIKVLLSTES